MRIVCPSCNAEYQVPDARLAPGRVVRCAQCSTGWTPVPAPPPEPSPVHELLSEPEPEPELPPPEPLPPAPEALTRLVPDLPPAPPRRDKALLAAWLLSVMLLGVAGWAAYTYRASIMHAWPASERAYALLHLAPGHE